MKEFVIAAIGAVIAAAGTVIAAIISRKAGNNTPTPPEIVPTQDPREGSQPALRLPNPRPKPHWPPPDQMGVWVIRLTKEYAEFLDFPHPPDSFVHFWWSRSKGGTSYLRTYAAPGPARWVKPASPEDVWRNIQGDVVVCRKNERRPVEDDTWWHSEIIRLNSEYPAS